MRSRTRVGAIDLAASAVVHVVPIGLGRRVDQLRLDAHALLDGLSGVRTASFSTRENPLPPPTALRDIDPIREILPDALGRRYEVMARDLRTVLLELSGGRLPVVVERTKPRPLVRATPVPAPERPLVVTAITHETSDAISIELADASRAAIRFTPGQFLTLFVPVDGTLRKRAYSISSVPTESGRVTVTVKRVAGGLVSGHLHSKLAVGETLSATGPSGSFTAPPATAPRHLVLVAGGSGITPMLSIMRSSLSTEPGTRVTLLFGNREADDVIFLGALGDLAKRHGERCRVVHLLERIDARSASLGARSGRPDHATIGALVRELSLDARLPGEDLPLFFVSGPAQMIDGVRSALTSAGVDARRIHEERFQSPPDAKPLGSASLSLPSTSKTVSVKRRGSLQSFTVMPGQTILEAATNAGAVLPSSCAMGGCAACRCRTLAGEVLVEEPNCLSTAEREAGYVLTCVGRPRTDVTLELP